MNEVTQKAIDAVFEIMTDIEKAKKIEQEIRWREDVQGRLPTDANQRRINYLRDRFLKMKEKRHGQ